MIPYDQKAAAVMSALKDPINPAHYNAGSAHETANCLIGWGLDRDALLWNAAKYISRAGKKDPGAFVEDLQKAIWYLRKRIEVEESRASV